ncbi:MAG: efflux RND transporter permease subunit [Chloroflexi bacterium]|nr:efflux RND transporter permease subunit [Chloroflexota bacterium]
MGLTRLAVTRPLAILMLILGIVLMGAVAYTRLSVDRLPNITVPFVSVSVSYPGAAPEDVESLVLQPIEDALGGVPGAQAISATAREGSGSVNIQLVEGTDVDKALIEVQRRVAAVRPQLPRDISDPRVGKFDPNAFPVMNLALTGENQEQLTQLGQDVILPKLLSLPGVADVNLSGGLQREIRVALDLTRLASHGVSVEQITGALQRENLSVPAGSLEQGRTSVAVRSLGLFQRPEELGNLVVGQSRDGTLVYLRNLATITDTFKPQTRYQRLDGVDAVGLSIVKQSDANTLQVADAVRAALEPLRVALPAGSQLVITNDGSRFVRRSLDAVQFDLGLAAFLTATVLLLFLHTWRNTIIVLLAIPTSLISTMLVMYTLGFSLNLMTLMALAMTIGILVDDSIVVLENIHRHLRLGEPPRDAALRGRSEIGLAAMAITFTDIVVYLPVAFMQGNVGQLFRQYGVTVASATLFSLLVSFTLTPMLASRWLKGREEATGQGWWERFARGWESSFTRIAFSYGRLLGWSLGRRPLIVAIGGVALAGGLAMLPLNLLGREYAPQEDESQFSVNLQMPVGTSLAATDEAARQMEALLREVPEVRRVYATVGGGGGGFGGGASAGFTVEAVEKAHRNRPISDILAQVRTLGRSIPEATVRASVQNPLAGGGNFIAVSILGDDLPTLNQIATQVIEVAEGTLGIADATSSFQAQQEERRLTIDRDRAAFLGISTSQVASTLRTIIQGSTVSQLRVEGQPAVDITVVGQDGRGISPAALVAVPLTSSKAGSITLGQVTRLRTGRAPVQISRVDRKRSISVSATVAGRPVGDVAQDLRERLKAVALPPGYRWEVRGTVQQLEAAFAALLGALSLSVLLIYMLLVALYESWLYPLAIMFSLPVSLAGAFGGLYITGNTLNIFSMIGMIALMGLVAKNAILLVDYTNTLRERGLARGEALVEAGRTRLRPIVMTTATVIAAMLPLAFKIEAGAESRAPMAVVIIGGSISSTLLTLVLVPVMYTLLDDLQHRLRVPATFRWPWRRPAPAPAELEPAPVLVATGFSDGGDGKD